MERKALFAELREAVAWLAADSRDQQNYLREFHRGGNFDDVAARWLTAEQFQPLRLLNQKLDEMSGERNANLWRMGALTGAPEWEEVRNLGREALNNLP